MGLRLFLGEAASGKTTGMMDEIKAYLEGKKQIPIPLNGRVFVITPEQMTLKTEELLLSHLKRDALFQVEVLSFKRLATMVFQENGKTGLTYLDDVGKTMVLYRVLKAHQKELVYYGRSIQKPGFLSQLKLMITEMIQYHLDAESLRELSKAQPKGSILSLKLQDIASIFTWFTEETQQKEEKVLPSEKMLDLFAEEIPSSKKLSGSLVYLDGFTGFTPQQYRLMKELLLTAKEVTVSLTLPKDAYTYALKHPTWQTLRRDLFFTPSKTLLKLTQLSADLSTPLSTHWFTEGLFTRNQELVHVNQYLCATKNAPYEKPAENVKAFVYDNIQEEVTGVMHGILRCVREEGLSYKDIILVLADGETYIPVLKRQAYLYHIPLFVDEKVNGALNPYVRFVESLLELMETSFSQRAFLSLIKTGLTNVTRQECDLLENEVIRGNWMGKKAILEGLMALAKGTLTRGDQTPGEAMLPPELLKENPPKENPPKEGGAASYEALAKQLEAVYDAFTLDEADMTGALKTFIEDCHVYEKLQESAALLLEKGQSQKAMEFEKIYDAIGEVMEQLTSILHDMPVTREEYTSMLKAGIKEIKIGMVPAALDQVMAVDLKRSRVMEAKVMFILGLSGGAFPSMHSDTGLLSDQERVRALKSLEMAQGEKEDLMEQYYNLYLMLGKAREKIFLSSAQTGMKSEALGTSPLWKRVEKVLGQGYDVKEETLGLSLPYLYELPREKMEDDPVLALMKEAKLEGSFITKLEEGYDLHEEEKTLSPLAARKLMDPSQRLLSITQLEQYARCPYAYFLTYGLKLKERERPQVRQLEDGTVLHDLLYDAGEYLSHVLTDEEAMDLARKLADNKKAKYEVYETSGRFKYYWQKLQKTAARSLQIISQQEGLSDFTHAAFEWSFGGKASKGQEVRIPLSDGSYFTLMGKVDRVDIWNDQEETYVTVVDYKSGSTAYNESQLYQGLQLQLPVYMEAVRQHFHAKPAGYFYFHLIPAMDSKKDYDGTEITEEQKNNERLKQSRLDGVYLNDPELAQHLDKTIAEGKGLVVGGKITKAGTLEKNAKALEAHQFEAIETFVNRKMQALGDKMQEGLVERSPVSVNQQDPCGFCEYKNACPYDLSIPGTKIRNMEKLGQGEIFERMQLDQQEKEGYV